jgi:pentatricopeptide repeat protein
VCATMFRYLHGRRSGVTDVLNAGRRKAELGTGARRRRVVLSRIRDVRRVNSPESDMRPVLPNRSKLMAAVARPPRDSHKERMTSARVYSEKHMFLAALASRAGAAVREGSLDGLSSAAREAAVASYPLDKAQALRVVALSALKSSTESSQDSHVAEDVMSRLAADGVLFLLRREDLGMVLDTMTRGMITRRDYAAAFRVELLSRIFETNLRRGTYTQLVQLAGSAKTTDTSGLAMALGIFHRALVVGKKPNAAMFNTLLEVCFKSKDGTRARAVLAEMAREKVPINGATLSVLLRYTQDITNVDSVFKLLKGQVSGGKMIAVPGMAVEFIRAYIRNSEPNPSPTEEETLLRAARYTYVERCFSLVDWFYDAGIGVTRDAMDCLISHLGAEGNAEGALRAWREMRRGWLGSPNRRSRRHLVRSVCQSALPARVDGLILPRLRPHMGECEYRRLRRLQLAVDDTRDGDILSLPDVKWDVELARDKAAVLHRWVRSGNVGQALAWVSEHIKKNGSIDYRLLLALLGRSSPSRKALGSSSDVSGEADMVCEFVLDQLSTGRTVRGVVPDSIVHRVCDTLLPRIEASADSSQLLARLRNLAHNSAACSSRNGELPFDSAFRDRRVLYQVVSSIVRLAPEPAYPRCDPP